MEEIPGHLKREVLKWRRLERGRPKEIEIPGPGQESVWDYPRPPRLEACDHHIRVEFAGMVIAESVRTYRVLETASPPAYYIPPQDVEHEVLQASDHTTLCEWKGVSRYWSVHVDKRRATNAVWSYPNPWEGFEAIKGYLAFNASKMDACTVNGQRVTPQPGNFYGGWITPEIVGPFKGAPGTEHW
jgi:uncharacterized protein (DUF427 family)